MDKMLLGKRLILATVCFTGLQAGIAYSWPASLFAEMIDGKAQISLSPQDQVFILNSMLTFKLIGSTLTAFLMEKHGRRITLVTLSVLNLLSWVPNFIGSTVVWFCLSEALKGIFINMYVSVMPVVVGETIEADTRGAVNTLTIVAMGVGRIFISLLGKTNYILFNAIPAIPSFVLVLLCLALKETPYFSLIKEGKGKARERLIWFRGHCDENDLTKMEDQIQLQNTRSLGFKELFRRNTRKSLGLTLMFALLSKVSGYATIVALLAAILPKSSIRSTTAVLIMSITGMCSTTTSMFLVDRVGRKPLSFVAFLGAGIAFFVVAIWYYIHDQTSLNTASTAWIPIAVFALIEIFCNLGSQQLYHILIGELFSANVSGRASMIVIITTTVSLALFNQAFYPVIQAFGMSGAMFIYSGFNLIGCFCVYVFLIETKGKTLEDIQIDLSRKDAISLDENDLDCMLKHETVPKVSFKQ